MCVYAETSDINTAGGALLGGIDAIVGTLLGAMLGGGRERQDSEAVARFNNI